MLALIFWLGMAHASNCTLVVDANEMALLANEDVQAFRLLGYELTTEQAEMAKGAGLALPSRTCRRPLGIRLCENTIQIGEMSATGIEIGRPYRGSTMMLAILQLPYCSI